MRLFVEIGEMALIYVRECPSAHNPRSLEYFLHAIETPVQKADDLKG